MIAGRLQWLGSKYHCVFRRGTAAATGARGWPCGLPSSPSSAGPKVIEKARIHASASWASRKDDAGLFNVAGDYIKNLRLKAAETLTSSLPEEERNELISRVGVRPSAAEKDPEEQVTALGGGAQASIDEMVAEAKAEEAQRLSAEFEQEKEQLMSEMEEAARKRMENDIELQKRQIAFEKWKEDLEREKQQQGEGATNLSAAASLGDHPILGPVIYDLGYKRIHIASTDKLSSIPVWEMQRFYRHDRVKSMAKDKMKALSTGLPGVIGIYENQDGSLAVIDGQHRIGMLKVLSQKKASEGKFDFDRILVEVYTQLEENTDATEHATQIFQEINKAQPATLVDLPGMVDGPVLQLINEAATNLKGKYGDMFKPSQQCRRPHLNIDVLRNELFVANVIERHNIQSSAALEEWMMSQNALLAEKFEKDEAAKDSVPKAALAKAEKFGFYLGLDSTWYYN